MTFAEFVATREKMTHNDDYNNFAIDYYSYVNPQTNERDDAIANDNACAITIDADTFVINDQTTYCDLTIAENALYKNFS